MRFEAPNASLPRRALLAGLGTAAFASHRQAAAAPTPVNGIVIGKDGWLFAQWDAMGIVDLQRVRRVTGMINEAIGIFRRAGIETAISLTPSRARVYRDMLPAGLSISNAADQRYSQAARELQGANVLVPDFSTLFTRLRTAQPNQQLFFKADTHWTPAGAEAAAGEMARSIRERFRLPPSAKPGARLAQPVRMQHVTDLASLLPAAERSKYEGEPFNVRQESAVTGAGASLLDEDTADVTVVGNSYMHPRYGFALALSSGLQRPVSLTWNVHGNGPYRTMLNYLQGDTFRRAKPALIVWNFHELDLETTSDRRDVWRANAMPQADFLAAIRTAVGSR
jgi:alginate O-acetyltransferase complex protein AlgJ